MGGSWEDIMGTRGRHLTSPLRRRVSRHWALPLALALSLLTAGVAWGDQIVNNIDTTIDPAFESRTITSGSSTVVGFFVQPSNTVPTGDASGCNATGASPATVTLSVPAAVTASSTSLIFTSCGTTQDITFSSSLPASYTISVSTVSGGKSGSLWDTAPASFTLHVLPPPDTTPPVITPNLTGTLGANGWYTSDVAVSWTVTDPDSTVTSTTGCGPASVTSDTSGTTFTCSATSAGGTASASVTVKRDTTAPTISGAATPAPNGAGWNNTDVAVAFSCADATSGVASCGPNQTLAADGAGQSATGTATDDAGNSASATVSGINIDKTAPSVSATVSPTPNGGGWNTGDVTVSFSGTDALSGVASCDPAAPVTAEGTHLVSGSCTDAAGNSGTASVTVKIDRTDPTITATRTAPNGFGWNNTSVFVDFSCTDTPSGIASCGPNATLSSEGGGQSATGTATDNAGRSTSLTVSAINIDLTAPTISGAATPAPNANGWNNADVTVTFTCTDGLSGIDTCTDPVTLSSDGAGQFASGTATDKAGNTDSTTVSGINIDKTAPTISGAATPAPNANGWNNADVTVTFTCTDGLSGIATCTDPVTLSSDGAGQFASGTAADKAGNTDSTTVSGINIDKTAPTVECSQPDASVWYGSNVVVSCISSDATSGLADTADSTFTLSTTVAAGDETATATTGSRTVADLAGNSTTVGPFTFKVDRKAPEVTCGSPDGLWHAADVSIFCTAGDGGSGLTGPAAFTLSTSVAAGVETDSAYTGSVSVTDGVGNATTAGPIGPNKVDKQAPAITATRTPANVNGWNSGDVTVEFTCSDGGSGLASCAAPVTVSSEGANQAVTGTATDNVGNTASTEVSGINIDKTAPTISGAVGPTVLAVNTAASVNFTATDSLSGVDAEQYSVDGGPWTSASTPLIITTADVVNLCVRATDKAGNVSDPECVLLAVYDPSAGFVTGGGWIMSPAGAYVDAPAMTGKATFGFVSKYKKGATVPEGNTEFQFHAAGFNFKSTSYEWLVVSGSRAQYKGVGTVNGVPGYGFMLTAIDGSPDKFRIKVWSVATGDTVYDNQMGGADTADPTTALAGGSVVIHSTKK
jgi:hypothetical protein